MVSRLQSEAVLVRRPDFDGFVGMLRAGFCNRVDNVFSISCPSSVTARGWRGPGTWIDHSNIFKASHPCCGWGCNAAPMQSWHAGEVKAAHAPDSLRAMAVRPRHG